MAQANRTPVAPVRVFARRFVELHDLTPPVDVLHLLKLVADVEFDLIPGETEAVVIRKPGGRPKVVASKAAQARRLRFTLAHELGHLSLPWQSGSVFCHPSNGTYVPSDLLAAEIEEEAHHFASEILMPKRWLDGKLSSNDDLSLKIGSVIEEANVNVSAAMIACQVAIPFPALFCFINSKGEILYSHRSESCPAQAQDWPINPRPLESIGWRITETQINEAGSRILAASFELTNANKLVRPAKTSAEYLSTMLDGMGPSERRKMAMSIPGIIGAAFSQHGSSSDKLFTFLKLRFATHELKDHALLDRFIRARVFELDERTKAGPQNKSKARR